MFRIQKLKVLIYGRSRDQSCICLILRIFRRPNRTAQVDVLHEAARVAAAETRLVYRPPRPDEMEVRRGAILINPPYLFH
jgi:hypothetical protein